MPIPAVNIDVDGGFVRTIVAAKPKAVLERELSDFIHS